MDQIVPLQVEDRDLTRVDVVDQFRGVLVLLSVIAVLLPSAMGEWSGGLQWTGIQRQLEPSIWHGCTLFDLVKTSFLFVAGISTSLSVSRRLQQGETYFAIIKHLAGRSLFLFLVGLVIDGGILTLQWPLRLCGCFQQIAVCKFLAGAIELLFGRTIALLLAGMVLLNYGFALETATSDQFSSAVHANDAATNVFSMNQNLAAQIDRQFLFGRKYFGYWDPQGLVVTLPALAMTLIGTGCTSLVAQRKASVHWVNSWGRLVFAGLALVQGGVFFARWQPLNAWLLSPPFVIVTLGASLVAVGLLAAIDWLNFLKHGLNLFSQIGKNCLVLMISLHLIDYFAYVSLFGVCDLLGLSFRYGHTLVAMLFLIVLGCFGGRLMRIVTPF